MPVELPSAPDLEDSIPALLQFTQAGVLTTTIAQLEAALDGSQQEDIAALLEERGVSPEVLRAAMLARSLFGRINDVIHATAIALSLPHLLEPGETLRRPSLAAGNDPSRKYDLETDCRVAEFKLSRWGGADAMRKRHLVKDLVHLAADTSGRVPELYVLGARPERFLRETRASVAWGLDRFPPVRAAFEERFGSLDTPIATFVAGPAAQVRIIDLERRLPALFPPD